MPHTPPPLTLLPQQSRLINATEGFRLEVQSGCLWLTRPSDCVDRFLVAGASIELHENLVLIQSDTANRGAELVPARYTLTPLQVPTAAQPVASDKVTSKDKSSSPIGLQPLWGLRKQLFN